ncbi:MAG: ABC transporter permease [Gallionellaceae bacterium]|jgi:ABC-2 type transport system permease protein|nr:ABC transporter permease [Gallionellaceae bacterium]
MLAALIKKELLALTRDLHGLAALFLMPLIFIVVMSLALKDAHNPPHNGVPYAIDARDNGATARTLIDAWMRSHGAPQPLTGDWQTQLRTGRLKYVIVLQANLSDSLERLALPTEPQLQLLTDPGINGYLFNALQAELISAAGEIKGRLAFDKLGLPTPPDASITKLVHAERYGATGPQPTSVQQNVPAWLVFGMFFVVAAMSSLFIQERASGTLGRLQSIGVPNSILLLAKGLPYFGVNALQAVLMFAAGVWLVPLLGGDALSLTGINWGALAFALATISLAAISLSLALASAVRTHAQAATAGPIINVLMAAIGGIMVPTFVMPLFMQNVAVLSPMNWALEALLTVLLRGGGFADVWPYAARLLLFSVIALALAVLLFKRRA